MHLKAFTHRGGGGRLWGQAVQALARHRRVRGLTLRSRADPLRRAVLPAWPRLFIVGHTGKPSRLRGPLSSKVRQQRVASAIRHHSRAAMGREVTASSRARCPVFCMRSFGSPRLSALPASASPRRFLFAIRSRCPASSPGACFQALRAVPSRLLPACASFFWLRACCLTGRSSGPPPAWHLAREALWSIVRLAGQAPFRQRPLSSNVRPRK